MIECWRSGLLAEFSAITAAWERSLPALSCPVRVENGRVLFRHPAYDAGAEWGESFLSKTPYVWWSFIEEEVTGDPSHYPDGPKITAVLCLGGDKWKPIESEEKACQ